MGPEAKARGSSPWEPPAIGRAYCPSCAQGSWQQPLCHEGRGETTGPSLQCGGAEHCMPGTFWCLCAGQRQYCTAGGRKRTPRATEGTCWGQGEKCIGPQVRAGGCVPPPSPVLCPYQLVSPTSQYPQSGAVPSPGGREHTAAPPFLCTYMEQRNHCSSLCSFQQAGTPHKGKYSASCTPSSWAPREQSVLCRAAVGVGGRVQCHWQPWIGGWS